MAEIAVGDYWREYMAELAQELRRASHAPWPRGPLTLRKSTTEGNHPTIGHYVDWVIEVEDAYPLPGQAIHRLRRLYYSRHSADWQERLNRQSPGPRFDKLIEPVTPEDEPPLEADGITLTQGTLDSLYETDAIIDSAGNSIDISHLLVALDASIAGVRRFTLESLGGLFYFRNFLLEVLTWGGDVASWWHDWNDTARLHRDPPPPGLPWTPDDEKTFFFEVVDRKVSRDDLLGDIDGVVLAEHYLTPPDDLLGPDTLLGPETSLPTEPLWSMLSSYYRVGGASPGPGQPDHRERFHRFVAAAGIPHTVRSTGPFRVELQESAALEHLTGVLMRIADTFVAISSYGFYWPGFADEVTMQADYVRWIADYFLGFLADGLETGDPTWPPARPDSWPPIVP